MQVFDLNNMKAYSYEQRDKNVFYNAPEFKARIIELPAGGEMPACEMKSYVVFTILHGAAIVTVNQQKTPLQTGQCLITEPATLSIQTENGARILGLQVTTSKNYL